MLQSDKASPDQRNNVLPSATQNLCQTLAPYSNFIKAAHVNVQSLFCHIDEFRTIFQQNICDIILISESWLKPNVTDTAVELPGYTLYRNDRLYKGGGGVAAFINSNLNATVLQLSDTSLAARPEFMFFEVRVTGTPMLVGVCYRAPGLGFLDEFEHVLLDLMVRYSHVIIMGDFNSNLLGPATHDQTYLTTMFHSCGMTILPLQATHHTSTCDTWLDVMAISDSTHIVHHGQLSVPGLSKHDLVFCVYRLLPPKPHPQIIRYRYYKGIDFIKFHEDALRVPWDEIISGNDIDRIIIEFNRAIITLFDKHAPITTKRVTRKPAPWITDHIRQLQRQRDSAFRKAKRTKIPNDWIAYKRLRNKVQQQFRNAKIRFFYNSFSNKKSSKTMWSKVKQLGISKSTAMHPISLDLNVINDYFVNIPVDVTRAQDYYRELTDAPLVVPCRNQFSFTAVTESDVLRAVLRLTSNAVGADNIPIKFIKDSLSVTLPVITSIFNKSLSLSVFPAAWKNAIVRPLQKNTSPTTPSDYRPISILPALSKCLERIVHNQMSSYIEHNNILSNIQSGFRPQHSTTSALLKITEDIRSAMDKRQGTVLTLFDFSKAFDCVYHPLLLFKLKAVGFSESCVGWVESYLSNRRQCVKTYNNESCWRPVTRGVPQGSVLGPLLFSLYINDVTTVIQHSQCHLYADDLQIYQHFPISNFQNTVNDTNIDITSIISWANRHGLKLNESKTQVIVIGSSRLIPKIDLTTAPKLKIMDHYLDYSDKVKNLGLLITRNLGWKDQIVETCNKVFSGIHSLKRFAPYLPFDMKVILVSALIFPYFNYCDIVMDDMTVELSDKLQRAQNYCIRFIFNLRRDAHVTPFFNHLSLLKLKELRQYHALTFLHAVLKTGSPRYIFERFKFLSQISSHSTRYGSSQLSIPHHNSMFLNKSFTVSVCRSWNSLPDSLRNMDDSAGFRAGLKDLLLRTSRV